MSNPEATVAVPVKDRRDRMLRCLDALLAQDHPSYEILVLDNGSRDGTAEACRERASGAAVTVRVEVVHGTLGRVRNSARELARGRYLAYTDSDCVPAPQWLSEGVRALQADGSLGFVCGMTLPEVVPDRPWSRTVRVDRFSWRFESCNVIFRTDALRAGAGFDEHVGDGWEDTAAGFDLLARGWTTAFAHAALVRHDVTYPGFWYHVRREQRQRNAAAIVRRFPQARRHVLFGGMFLNRGDALFFLALVGLLVPRARMLLAPYVFNIVTSVRPQRWWQRIVLDGAMHIAVLRGAVRHRTLIL